MLPPDTGAPLFLCAQKVAALLDISVRTLWRLVEAGRFPQPVRFNRKLVRWKAADVAAWVARQPTMPPREAPCE